MKLGIAISAIIVLGFAAGLVFMNMDPGASPPTDATSGDRLAKQRLPQDLPKLVKPTRDTDAAPIYRDAITHYLSHQSVLSRPKDERPDQHVQRLRERMVEAMQAKRVTGNFLDKYLPMKPGPKPKFDDALEAIQRIMVDECNRLYDSGFNNDSARDAGLALWTLGRRAFEENVRLFNRRQGLALMRAGGSVLLKYSGEDSQTDAAALRQWGKAIRELEAAWRPKVQVVRHHDPHAGDLLNMARHDEDLTFRIAATLHLGVAQYTADGEANRNAVKQALDELASSGDPRVKEAAGAAKALTKREMRLIR